MCVLKLREQEAQSASEERNMEGSEFIVGGYKNLRDRKLPDCS